MFLHCGLFGVDLGVVTHCPLLFQQMMLCILYKKIFTEVADIAGGICSFIHLLQFAFINKIKTRPDSVGTSPSTPEHYNSFTLVNGLWESNVHGKQFGSPSMNTVHPLNGRRKCSYVAVINATMLIDCSAQS